MRLLTKVAALGFLLAGCSGTGGPGAAPEITSMLNFAAYPGATLLHQQTSESWAGPFGVPGNFATRTYETSDSPQTVRVHYENLAKTHGWTFQAPTPMPSAMPDEPVFFTMRRQRFQLAYDIRRGGFNYPLDPAATPDPNAKTQINVSASSNN